MQKSNSCFWIISIFTALLSSWSVSEWEKTTILYIVFSRTCSWSSEDWRDIYMKKSLFTQINYTSKKRSENFIAMLQAARFSLWRLLGEFPGSLNATCLSLYLHHVTCTKPTPTLIFSEKKGCAKVWVSAEGKTGEGCLILLLSLFLELSWVDLFRHEAAQTPNLNVLNTSSTVDCSLSSRKCLVFFPVWVQLKLQDICQTGWDSFTTLSIPLQYCEKINQIHS